jgi:hypothetical protein
MLPAANGIDDIVRKAIVGPTDAGVTNEIPSYKSCGGEDRPGCSDEFEGAPIPSLVTPASVGPGLEQSGAWVDELYLTDEKPQILFEFEGAPIPTVESIGRLKFT